MDDRFTMVFDRLDIDGNGVIERSDIFDLADALVREGGLDADDPAVWQIGRALGELWELLLKYVDADASGSVDRDEFLKFVKIIGAQLDEFGSPPPTPAIDVVRTMWVALDTDGDSRISPAEYAAFLRAVGSDADPVSSFDAIDTDGDGSLDIMELEQLVRRWFVG